MLPPPWNIGRKKTPIIMYATDAITAELGPLTRAHIKSPGICHELFNVSVFRGRSNLGSNIAEGTMAPIRINIIPVRAPLQVLKARTIRSS